MTLNRRKIKSTDLKLVGASESYSAPLEPPIQLGNFVRLNSGGPTMIVVDDSEIGVVVAWMDRAGTIREHYFPDACVHSV